jgi:hypothetical protein
MATETPETGEFPPKQHGERVTYSGSCHCNAVQYKVTHGNLQENQAIECNCSICKRNGYLFIYIPPEDFVFENGDNDALTVELMVVPFNSMLTMNRSIGSTAK